MLWIRGLTAQWISQHFVFGRIYPGLSALWISQHVVLGRIYPLAGLAVD